MGQMHHRFKCLGIQTVKGVRNKEETLVHAIDFEARVLGEVMIIIRPATGCQAERENRNWTLCRISLELYGDPQKGTQISISCPVISRYSDPPDTVKLARTP